MPPHGMTTSPTGQRSPVGTVQYFVREDFLQTSAQTSEYMGNNGVPPPCGTGPPPCTMPVWQWPGSYVQAEPDPQPAQSMPVYQHSYQETTTMIVVPMESAGCTYYVRPVIPSGLATPNSLTQSPCTSGLSSPALQYELAPDQHRNVTSPLAVSVCSSPPANINHVKKKVDTTRLEMLWHGDFDHLFQEFSRAFGHRWVLRPACELPVSPNKLTGYHIFKDSAKVRFSCKNCGKGWTSMKGRVSFFYKLERGSGLGDVVFSLYGQQCSSCAHGFEHAMWYPDEVRKVVENVWHRVRQSIYHIEHPTQQIRIDRRPGKPVKQHDPSLCEACAQGFCSDRRNL